MNTFLRRSGEGRATTSVFGVHQVILSVKLCPSLARRPAFGNRLGTKPRRHSGASQSGEPGMTTGLCAQAIAEGRSSCEARAKLNRKDHLMLKIYGIPRSRAF